MKRLICFILILIFAFPFVSCAVAEEEKTAPGTAETATATKPASEALVPCTEKETEELDDIGRYYTFVCVRYLDENGFAGDGAFPDFLYVSYPEAQEKLKLFDNVKIWFLGKDFHYEEKTLVSESVVADPPYEFVCHQTIDQVQLLKIGTEEKYWAHSGTGKPILYFYPEEETKVSVALDLDGGFTCTYPAYGENGWEDFTASPDGTLTFPDGKRYYALYWEGVHDKELDFSRGFCVKGSDAATFLEEILPKLGLNIKEANEFIVYWLPKLQENPYNLIAFQGKGYTDHARLAVTPEPDTLIRVLMAYQPLNAPVQIEPQKIETPERRGFTVVEWGGCEV